MWRDFLESGEEWALVAEDDALIHPSIDKIVSRVIENPRSIGVVNFADGWSTQMGRYEPPHSLPPGCRCFLRLFGAVTV